MNMAGPLASATPIGMAPASTPWTTLGAAAAQPDPMGHVLPHYLFGSHWFTNHHLMSLVVLALGVAALALAARGMQTRPQQGVDGYVTKGRFAQLIETLCVFIRDEMTRPLLGKLTDRYIFYLWSAFFFILLANLLGMVPLGALSGLIAYTVEGWMSDAATEVARQAEQYKAMKAWSHFGGTMTGNLAFTGGLALVAFIAMNGIALKENGFDYVKHAFPVPMQPLYLSPLFLIVNIFIAVMELIVAPIIRSFALAVRLGANMIAGHLVLGSLIIMALAAPAVGKGASVLGAALFSFLELFVAFLQAYIFTFLLAIFISLGAVHHDEHDEHEAGLDEGAMPGEEMGQGLSGTDSPRPAGAH